MEHAIISRDDARAQALQFYFTGKPCKHGHVAERSVITTQCRTCMRLRAERLARARGVLPREEHLRHVRARLSDEERQARKVASWRASYHRQRRKRGLESCSLEELRSRQAAKKAAKEAERQAARALKKRPPQTLAGKRALQKAWREANRDRMRELIRNWKRKNPEKAKLHRGDAGRRRRRREWLRTMQKGRCAICSGKLGKEVHIDHIVPLALGGPDRRSNLQLTHPACNMAKRDIHPVDHARSLGRLL